ncbi:MAG: ankyrin repeat domain-containing protein [Arenimonas sp.]|uniref:ankyrin repeat domain-containing protein n=1 Tax=Arenimonas sp. TaxID=1872635 RepID=UPI003BFE9A00
MVEFGVLALKLAMFHAVMVELLKAGAHPKQWRFVPMLKSIGHVAAAWLLLQCGLALLLIWPIQAVQQTQSLLSALALSVAAGLVVLGLQRIWPNWSQWQQDYRQGWPTFDATHPLFAFWRSALAGFILLLLAVPPLLTAAGWAFWPQASSLWLLGYGVLALLWHAVAVNQPLPKAVPVDASAAATSVSAKAAVPSLDPDIALLQAVHNGQVDAALLALDAGANPHQLPTAGAKDQRSLMMIAGTLSDLRLMRTLIGSGVDVNAFHAGLNPLLSATRDSWHGRSEAVTMLLTNGARTDVTDPDGNTPLHHAMRSTDAAVAALLLDAGADIEAVNRDGYTPLALACQAANWRVARYMLERKAKVEPAGAVPVMIAAAGAEDDEIGIRLLHKHKAKVDVRHGAQMTPLMVAAQAGLTEVVSALLELGAQVNAQDDAGITAYMLAAQAGEVEVLKRLQAQPKLSRSAVDAQGRSALDHALANGRWSAVACIDPAYALPEHFSEAPAPERRSSGGQQLFTVLGAGDIAAAEDLLRAGMQPAGPELAELMLSFCQQDRREVVSWLLGHGASVFSSDAQGRSVYARLMAGTQNLAGLLGHLMAMPVPISGSGTLAAYLECCLRNDFHRRADEQTALQLLQQGADPFGAVTGASPLVWAVRLGWQRVVDALLACGCDVNAPDDAGLTALHHAALLGRDGMLKPLILAGGDPERRARDGQSALGVALLNGQTASAAWLSWPNWHLPGRRLSGQDVPAAVLAGDAEAVKRLLELGLPVNAFDGKGSTALIHACGQGQTALVRLLLAQGADAGVAAASGVNALWAALSQAHTEVLQELLFGGADVNQKVAGYPPLHLASALGSTEHAAMLLEYGADVQARDGQTQTALHAAAGFLTSEKAKLDSVLLIDSLLRAGIPTDAADKHGQTALHLLCGASLQKSQALKEGLVLSALDRLLQEAPAIDALDARGFTPLHHAAARGYSQLAARLLRAGADRQLRDNLGRSAYDFAVMGGFSETANLLQDRPERVDIASLLIKKDQG